MIDTILIDCDKLDELEYARQGSPLAMLQLAKSFVEGDGVPSNPGKALMLLEDIIAKGRSVWPMKVRWNAMILRANILAERGEQDATDEPMITIIREMVELPPRRWNLEQMISCLEWLQIRQEDGGKDFAELD